MQDFVLRSTEMICPRNMSIMMPALLGEVPKVMPRMLSSNIHPESVYAQVIIGSYIMNSSQELVDLQEFSNLGLRCSTLMFLCITTPPRA